jgi:hypothetical protein
MSANVWQLSNVTSGNAPNEIVRQPSSASSGSEPSGNAPNEKAQHRRSVSGWKERLHCCASAKHKNGKNAREGQLLLRFDEVIEGMNEDSA